MCVVSSEWQCGHCLVGGESLLTLHCTNNGGEGDFRLTTEDGDINNEVCSACTVHVLHRYNYSLLLGQCH